MKEEERKINAQIGEKGRQVGGGGDHVRFDMRLEPRKPSV